MALKFLDKDGLAYFWGKIQAKLNLKVSKSGDTMTGNLTTTGGLYSDSKAQIKFAAADNSAQTLQEDVSRDAFLVVDANNATIGVLRVIQRTNGEIQTHIGARRQVGSGTVFNMVVLGIAADGTRTVSVSDALAWRAAIGAKATQNAVGDPTASGNALAFIDSIAQNAQGVITASKKNVKLDSAPTANSDNPVKSGGVKTALDGKVSKSGDTMTGNLTNTKGFYSDARFQVNDGNMDITAQTLSSAVSHDAFAVSEANDRPISIFRVTQKTDSEIQTQIGARREIGNNTVFNTVLLGIASDGTQTVSVGNRQAWRRALSCEMITADLGTITGTGGTVTVTKTVAGVTSNMTPCMIYFDTPNAVLGDVTITTAENSVRFSAKVCGSTTVKVKLSNNSDVSGT